VPAQATQTRKHRDDHRRDFVADMIAKTSATMRAVFVVDVKDPPHSRH